MELKPALVVDGTEHASKAVSEISRTGLAVVVMRQGKYFGLIDDRELRRHPSDISKTRCETFACRAPQIEKSDSLDRICNAFFSGRWKAVPVIEKGKVLGLLTRADVIKMLLEGRLLKGYKVSDVMSSPVVSIESKATLANAKSEMKKRNVRRLVVTKNGYIEGMLSSFDLSQPEVILAGENKPQFGDKANPDLYPVSSYMRKSVHTIEPFASLADAARMMIDEEISAVVAGESGKAAGIVTARDLFETAMRAGKNEVNRIMISGLEGDDRDQVDAINDECRKFISKMEKSHSIESLSLHIKKYGKKYSARARLIAKEILIAGSHEWDLRSTVTGVLSELKKQMDKRKPNKMHQKSEEL